MTDTPDAPVRVAALQYCAAGTAAETLPFLLPMITRAAKDGATLVCLPEAASFLAANRASLREEAETEQRVTARPLTSFAIMRRGTALRFLQVP